MYIYLPSILDNQNLANNFLNKITRTHYEFLTIKYNDFGLDLIEYLELSNTLDLNKKTKSSNIKKLISNLDINNSINQPKNTNINNKNNADNISYSIALIPVIANAGLNNVSINLIDENNFIDNSSHELNEFLLKSIHDIMQDYDFKIEIKHGIWYMHANWLRPFKTYHHILCMVNGAKDYLIQPFEKHKYKTDDEYQKAIDCTKKIKKIISDIQIAWFQLARNINLDINQNNIPNLLWVSSCEPNYPLNNLDITQTIFRHNTILNLPLNNNINHSISQLSIWKELVTNGNNTSPELSLKCNNTPNNIFYDDFLIEYYYQNNDIYNKYINKDEAINKIISDTSYINNYSHNIKNNCINKDTGKNTYIVTSTAKSELIIFKPKKWYHFLKF